ncbi:nibrin isoform X2 [Ceratina calcarata]|uniref:Nibrin isoform X2 n=1 Tax=Ceratina calcarata TaxID=156304 RepID=A0AAJ7N841_9HYME|nr:nibrin isoform X2 [Ceratina calcarata]
MWYINLKGRRVYLTPKEEFTFGRKSGDLSLPNDQSLSRLHASICVIPKKELKVGKPTSICIVKDLNSKYGSYILHGDNKTQISAEGYQLKDGDQIQLGLQDTILTVVHVPIVTLTSSLNHEDKTNLARLMTKYIDGVIANKWVKCCTHLTAVKPILTEKVTFAMAAGLPIVTLEYWEEMRFAMKNGQPLPDPKNYTPLIAESVINKNDVSLCPNMERKTLFADRIFVFLCKEQYESYRQIIELAGGNAVVYSRESFAIRDLCSPNVIVLQYPFTDASESTQNIVPDYDKICDALSACHRKMILATEIPISLLYCSTKRFCNPTFRMEKLLKQRAVKSDKSKVLVIDTQDPSSDVRILPNVISNIPVRVAVDHHKRSIQIIPDTCDNFNTQNNDSIPNQANDESTFLKSENVTVRKGARKRKAEIIPETVESLPQEKEESSGNEKGVRISFVDDVILIPDTNESPLKERNTNVHTSQKTVTCIPETNDSTQENTPESDDLNSSKRRKVSPAGNPVCIPETINSRSLNISSKSTQPHTHKNKSLTNEESSNSREIHDMLNQLPEIQLVPKKSTFSSVSKEKKDVATVDKDLTTEASNDRNKDKKGSQRIQIIPETPQNDFTNSDGNLMQTPTASSKDSSSSDVEISIVKSIINDVLEKKKDVETLDKNLTGEASNNRSRDKIRSSSEIEIVPETPEKNVENSEGNLMSTPTAFINDINNSVEIPIMEWQIPLNKEVDKNRNKSTEEHSNQIVTSSTASPNQQTTAYCKRPHPYFNFAGGDKHLWKTHETT